MFKKSLEDILSGFHRTKEDLKRLVGSHTIEIALHDEVIMERNKAKALLEEERAKAMTVIGNIEAFLEKTFN